MLPKAQADLFLRQYDALLSNLWEHDNAGDKSPYPMALLSHIPPQNAVLSSKVFTLHGLFEQTAAQFPERLALEFFPVVDGSRRSERWTFRQVEEMGNRYANFIRAECNLPVNALIAICFDKCPEASFALLGVLKAGCAFVAIDPGAPVARKRLVVEDSRASVILTTAQLADEFAVIPSNTPVLCVEDLETSGVGCGRPGSADMVKPSDPGYCLYTSGSTGIPKGCVLSHENAIQFIKAFHTIFAGKWDENSRSLQFASLHFDVSVMEHFWPWSAGFCVVSTPRDVLFADLPGALRRLDITHIDLTPSLARLITPDLVPSLCKGVFITGGEPLRQEVLDAWGETGVIHNGYGPTEVTIGCTMLSSVPVNGKPSNIGHQYPNAGTYVFTPGTTRLVPRGAVGELCISGKLVGQGYLDRPELTAESFPFVEEYGERLYRTKDLVRLLHDNTFDFLGRCDDQVKLRGQRLELGEVNAAVRLAEVDVEDVISLVIRGDSSDRADQLVSFVVSERREGDLLASQDDRLVRQIRNACEHRLPGYMVPQHIVMLNSMPLSANNKSDSKQLRELFERYRSDPRILQDPQGVGLSATEANVADIFASMFKIDRTTIQRSSNIFELGLDSIAVFPLSRALIGAGYGTAHPALILQSQTIVDLAKALSWGGSSTHGSILAAKQRILACQQRYRAFAAKSLGVEAEALEIVTPCTPLQQGMIARSLRSQDGLYFNSFVFELRPGTDFDKLRHSWQSLADDVAILRTRFVPSVDGHVAVVLRKVVIKWEMNVTMDGDSVISDFTSRCRKDWVEENNNIIEEPLQLLVATRRSTDYLVVNIFHGLYDAVSFDLMLQRVARRYFDVDDNGTAPAFHNMLHHGPLGEADGEEEFWKHRLDAAPFTSLPRNKSSGSYSVSARRELHFEDIFELARRRLNVTHQAIVQTAWLATLQSHLGKQTTVGMVVSGRSIAVKGAEDVIGPMFNTIPCFVDISAKDSWQVAVAKSHDFNVSSLPYQHTPLRNIEKWTRERGRHPLFDSLFVFQKRRKIEDFASRLWKEIDSPVQADYPLAFEAERHSNNALSFQVVAQTSFMNESDCSELLGQFEIALSRLLLNSEMKIQDTLRPFEAVGANSNGHVPRAHGELHGSCGGFQWTDAALALRHAVADLARLAPEEVQASTSVFEIGLDSIDAIKISSAMRAKGHQLTVSDIVRGGTIADISALASSPVDVQNRPLKERHDLIIAAKEYIHRHFNDLGLIEDVLPATPLQEALVAEMRASHFKNYFNHDVLQLRTGTDLLRLEEAWSQVVDQSPILRTLFVEIDDPSIKCSFVQCVLDANDPRARLRFHKCVGDQSVDECIEGIRKDFSSSFTTDVPLRLTILRKSREETAILILSMSHALYDGWSLALLHHDVASAYHGKLRPRPSYADTVQRLVGAPAPDAEEFWRNTVSSTPGCRFPAKDSRDETVHRTERRSRQSLDEILAFCKQQKISVQSLGLLCWTILLAFHTKSLDVLFGVVLSGRDDQDSQEILYPTMNTVAVRSIVHGSKSQMLQYTQSNMADVLKYQHYPLRKVQQLAALEGKALFNTLFIYQKRPMLGQSLDAPYELVGGPSSVEYPVCVEMEIFDGRLVWRTACRHSALSRDQTEHLLLSIDGVLSNIIKNPDAPTACFSDHSVKLCGLPAIQIEHTHASGKDRYDSQETDGASHSTGWTETEIALREALAAVAQVPGASIQRHHTIFHLGLDSISAIKVVSILRKGGMHVDVSKMIKAGTIREIARIVDENPHERHVAPSGEDSLTNSFFGAFDIDAVSKRAGFEPDTIDRLLPASAAQVYFLTQWQASEGRLFSTAFYYRILGSISLERLRTAWKSLVEETPILHTTFATTTNPELPMLQIILRNSEESFSVVDEVDGEGEIGFDFAKPPVELYAQELKDEIRLRLYIHHALYDAVSLPFMIHRLQDICNDGERAHEESATTFSDFLGPSALAEAITSRRRFWTEYLSGNARGRLSTSWIKTPRTTLYRPASFGPMSSIISHLRRYGMSIYALFIAAFASIYATKRLADDPSADLIIGVYLANRSSYPDLHAPTVNLVPLRIRQPAQSPLVVSARQVQDDLHKISSDGNEMVGLWEIAQWTGVKIDCFVNFIHLPGKSGELETRPSVRHGACAGPIKIEGVEGETAAPKSEDSCATRGFEEPKALRDNLVKDAYPASLDVEAAVRDDALDIGVFGPKGMADAKEAEDIIRRIVEKLATFS